MEDKVKERKEKEKEQEKEQESDELGNQCSHRFKPILFIYVHLMFILCSVLLFCY